MFTILASLPASYWYFSEIKDLNTTQTIIAMFICAMFASMIAGALGGLVPEKMFNLKQTVVPLYPIRDFESVLKDVYFFEEENGSSDSFFKYVIKKDNKYEFNTVYKKDSKAIELKDDETPHLVSIDYRLKWWLKPFVLHNKQKHEFHVPIAQATKN